MSFMNDALSEAGKHGLIDPAQAAPAAAQAEPVAAVPPPNPELEALRAELAAAKATQRNDKIGQAISDAASKAGVLDPSIAVMLLKNSVKLAEDGTIQVLTDAGVTRLNSSYVPMSVTELVNEFSNFRPYLVRSELKSGAGSTPSMRYDSTPPVKLSTLFGPGSSSRAAHELGRTNMAEYKRLRVLAKAAGLVD